MIEINKIGYFKYRTDSTLIVDCIKEFPITEEIKKFLSNQEYLILDTVDGEPNIIDGKFVVLV